jgi:hypothetical protein
MNKARTEKNLVISAFREGLAVAAIARRIGRKPGSVTWILKQAGLKPNNRVRPPPRGARQSGHVDQTDAFHAADVAFQQAMRRAIALGREHPPMIGIFKDDRPLDAPRLFEPVPHSSGCTSPALVCAELAPCVDSPLVGSAEVRSSVRAPRPMPPDRGPVT